MPRPVKITLSSEDHEYLYSLSKSRTIQAQVVDRARILLQKEDGIENKVIANGLGINVNTVSLCLKKYHEGDVENALFDKERTGRPVEITSDAIAWLIDIACQRPADLGYSQELWTLKNLHQHIQKNAETAGFLRLTTITKARVQQILKESDIKPFKIKYYCEKRDPDFKAKMHNTIFVLKHI